MIVLPVIDLVAGRVVRAVAGRRENYRRLEGRLTASSEPLEVAQAFASHFGLSELYLADLDAIAGAPPAREVYGRLRAAGFRLWVDAGARRAADATKVAGEGIERVVVGLETVAGPQELARAIMDLGERVVFSLDLRNGVPLGDVAAWPTPDAAGIAEHAIALGVRRLIVLDLARVGTAAGPGCDDLCTRLAPRVQLIAGGGIRNAGDLQRMRDAGIHGALVASAFHDGTLSRDDLVGL
jgi:phosphoribosylformimino-5-aminoimidazole carboxamide ribotide isomerase